MGVNSSRQEIVWARVGPDKQHWPPSSRASVVPDKIFGGFCLILIYLILTDHTYLLSVILLLLLVWEIKKNIFLKKSTINLVGNYWCPTAWWSMPILLELLAPIGFLVGLYLCTSLVLRTLHYSFCNWSLGSLQKIFGK